ncbi:hypothetical protein Hypma_005612 [Hypsizygus marmoreus]|uniref:VWFA domain-containing protein n=1 Tax=Hypsizygus marmoreus TaxID=39966 RepID=A0A369JW44_HYPMA|nr:hypothetical protein Hypma_005612 [Hypsizygus marmoreus]
MRSLKRFITRKTQAKASNIDKDAPGDPALVDYITPNEDVLSILKRYDTVFVVDDSYSMRSESRWKDAEMALASVAQAAASYDADGIEIHFLNSPISESYLKSAQAVNAVFNSVQPRGGTPLGSRMGVLLADYLARLKKDQSIKPVNYIVITDGEPTDGNMLEDVIVRAAGKLDAQNASPMQVGIQFVQVGDSASARRYLEALDDLLKHKHHIRDMVDTTPSQHGKLDIVKVLLGAINRRVDVKGSGAFAKA